MEDGAKNRGRWTVVVIAVAVPRLERVNRHAVQRRQFYSDVQVHAFLLWFEVSEPLTRVDTERGFVGNLKAGGGQFGRLFWGVVGRQRGPLSQAKDADRQDRCHFTEPLVGRQARSIGAVVHGNACKKMVAS